MKAVCQCTIENKDLTMKIGLHDAEKEYLKNKSFPNYALMKISAWHKAQGDTVEWWNPLYKYDKVYSSKVFDFTPTNPYLYNSTKQGIGRLNERYNHRLLCRRGRGKCRD